MSDLFSPSLSRQLNATGFTFSKIRRSHLTASSPGEIDNLWSDDPYGTGLRSTQQIDFWLRSAQIQDC